MKIWSIVIFCLLGWCSSSFAASVTILLSKESKMFNDPLAGIKGSCKGDINILNMSGNMSKGHQLSAEINSKKPAVVVALGSKALNICKSDIKNIPVVFSMVLENEKPGGNITGVSLTIPMKMQLESFLSVAPKLKKVGIVYDPNKTGALVKAAKSAAGKLGLTIVEKAVADRSEVPNAIRSLKGVVDGLYLPPDRTVASYESMKFITLFTFENNLPFMVPTSRFVKRGALIALMTDFEKVGVQIGEMVNKILAGDSPASMPVEPPSVTVLVLNKKTAQTIGINIPGPLLNKATIFE